MLCATCRRLVPRGAPTCPRCGRVLRPGAAALELVLADGRAVPLGPGTLTIGRADDNALRLTEPTVSRHHARIVTGAGAPHLEDASSAAGTFLDGRRLAGPEPLRDGARIRLGEVELEARRPRGEDEADVTVLGGAAPGRDAERGGPRLRAGWALKRLEAAEGERRFVVRDPERRGFVALSADEAELLALLDGTLAGSELVAAARRRVGADGELRLARLLSALADAGLLEGVPAARDAPRGRVARLLRPRSLALPGAGAAIERLYERGGFLLFSRPVLALLALVAAAGAAAFAAGLLGGASTPLVVADDLGLGALVFLAGRLAVVLVHELAHGLALVAVGRRVVRAGLQLVVVLPLAFVDTSEAWFEPRRRRLVVTAAGPASDAVVGGAFALVALLAGADGALGQTAFQVALAAYVGALFNLNPFADRDGYHLLVDLLGEPDLRRRGRMRLARALAGRGGGPRGATALAYPVAALAWSVVGVGLTVVAVLRYAEQVRALAPDPVVPALVVALCALLLAPAALTVGVPLLQRRRSRR